MQVRHNTSLLEEAISHVQRVAALPVAKAEAAIHGQMVRDSAHRRLATGWAIAIAAVGIGLGLYFGLHQTPADTSLPTLDASVKTNLPGQLSQQSPTNVSDPVSSEPPVSATLPTAATVEQQPVAPVPTASAESEPISSPITTNYSKFAERTVSLIGIDWTISAGHHYSNELQQNWSNAWCYTSRIVDGVNVQIDLATRDTPSAAPIGPVASGETLTRSGLSPTSALALATHCPWLDERAYRIEEYVAPAGSSNPFADAEPKIEQDGQSLHFSGPIGANFLASLQNYQFDTLLVDSVGGSLSDALEAGRWLRSEKKAVVVEGECLSACVFVLAGGERRGVLTNARVGVHRFSSDNPMNTQSALAVAQETSSKILSYLEVMGIDTELFHVMSQTPAESMRYLEASNLHEWGLISFARTAAVEPNSPNIEQWFSSLNVDDRIQLQSDLILLGHYQGLIDGTFGEGTRTALAAYQNSKGQDPAAVLGPEEMGQLTASASLRYDNLGFTVVSDDRGGSDLMVPRTLLHTDSTTLRGNAYASSDGGMVLETISKPLAEQSFEELYQALSRPNETREITYKVISPARFVVAGKDAGESFYLFFMQTKESSVGFSLAWRDAYAQSGIMIAAYVASYFAPK